MGEEKMILVQVGKPFENKVRLPTDKPPEPIPGAIYSIEVETDEICEKKAATLKDQIMWHFNSRGLQIKSLTIETNRVEIQFKGSPFTWAEILGLLPSIFTLVGITIILISLYYVVVSVPMYIWGSLVLGFLIIYFAPYIAEAIKEALPP